MSKNEVAVFGGGCFWCTEAIFQQLKGVVSVSPGYAGGHKLNPTYNEVSTGMTGHAEVTKIEFDPSIIPYEDLLEIFMHLHDPTTLNRQGYDVGSQYRSIILYTNEQQKKIAEKVLLALNASKEFKRPIVTEIKPLEKFYEAEDYHKNYYANNMDKPYCQLIISPKLTHLRQKYSAKLK
jgi:peptide-methionine (S)-S-oxide reductase